MPNSAINRMLAVTGSSDAPAIQTFGCCFHGASALATLVASSRRRWAGRDQHDDRVELRPSIRARPNGPIALPDITRTRAAPPFTGTST